VGAAVWWFALPAVAVYAYVILVPSAQGIVSAFTNWSFGHPDAEFNGLANFEKLFLHDPTFRKALVKTLYYTALHMPLTLAASLGLAVLLNRKLRGVAFFRTAAFFPYITSIVAIALVWNLLFAPETGPINQILRFVGIDNPPG